MKDQVYSDGQYDYVVLDGKVIKFKKQAPTPDWTPKQNRLAYRSYVYGLTGLAILIISIALFIAVKLFGG